MLHLRVIVLVLRIFCLTFKNNGYQFIFNQFHPKKYLQKQEAMNQTIQSIRRKTNSNNGIYVHLRNEMKRLIIQWQLQNDAKSLTQKKKKKKHFYYFSETIVVGSILHLHRVELNRLKVNYVVRSYFILLHVFR